MRLASSLLLLSVATVGLQVPAAANAANTAFDRDCSDFGSQRAAQLFFLANNPAADPHRLDSDGDWIVCESNPGPYYYSRTPPSGGTADPQPKPKPKPQPQPVRVVKVIDGELVRVREGAKPSFVVHLLGVDVPKGGCTTRAAKKDLRSWVKPGAVVKVHIDKRAPGKDGRGNLWRALTTVDGQFNIGGEQVKTGFAAVDRNISFAAKAKYLRWEKKAVRKAEGFHGTC